MSSGEDHLDELTARCQPIASLVCHALGPCLRIQLGRSPDEPLSAYELAALRAAIARQDRAAADMLLALHGSLADVEARDAGPEPALTPDREPEGDWASRPVARENCRRPSSALTTTVERATYQAIDVTYLLRDLLWRADVNVRDIAAHNSTKGVVQYDEIPAFLRTEFDVGLLNPENDALHDLVDNSLGNIRLADLATFFGYGRPTRSSAGLEIESSDTVTSVAFSPDTRFVACGSMDCTVAMYSLQTQARVFWRRYEKQVGAVALGAEGLAVGCFGGHLEWQPGVFRGGSDDPMRWNDLDRKDVNALAINDAERELGAAGGSEVLVFSLETGAALYRVKGKGTVRAVSLASRVTHRVELADGSTLDISSPLAIRPVKTEEESKVVDEELDGTRSFADEGPVDVVASGVLRITKESHAVHLEGGGGVLRSVERSDWLSESESRYVDFARTSASGRHGDEDPETQPTIWANIENHKSLALGLRDRAPVVVRLRAAKLERIARKFVAFGGDSHQASVWSYHNVADAGPRRRVFSWEDVAEPDGLVPRLDRDAAAKLEWAAVYEYAVGCVCLSRDARRVAIAARAHVQILDLDQREIVFQHTSSDLVYGVALGALGKDVVVGGASRVVELFDVDTGAATYSTTAGERVRCVALSTSGKHVGFGGFDKRAHVHRVDEGASGRVVECADVVRSVSLDRAGRTLAVGGDDCCVRCYGLESADSGTWGVQAWAAEHRKKVWTVAVEPTRARYVAAGDYNNAVVVYDGETGTPSWQKTRWIGRADAGFVWSVEWSGDGRRLAIGHWGHYAYVVEAGTFEPIAAIRRADRVYSVSLSSDGSLVAVGGRDKLAAVYRLVDKNQQESRRSTGDNDTPLLTFETERQPGFVYAVALSRDDSLLAVGGVDCRVRCYSLELRRRVHEILQDGGIQNLAFSPVGYDLAIASEQNFVEVWHLADGACETKLALRRHTSSHSVSLSSGTFAFCSGSLVTVFGGGRRGGGDDDGGSAARGRSPSWDDRVSFDVAQSTLDHPKALDAMLRRHPTIVNAVSPLSNESLLQYAVRKKSAATVDRLLATKCRVGLLRDVNGHDALSVALDAERKSVLARLLDKTMGTLASSPLQARSFMDIHAAIADKYPDLYLDFLESIRLVRDDGAVKPHRNFALVPAGVSFIAAGSNEHTPKDIWDSFLLQSGSDSRTSTTRSAAAASSSSGSLGPHLLHTVFMGNSTSLLSSPGNHYRTMCVVASSSRRRRGSRTSGAADGQTRQTVEDDATALHRLWLESRARNIAARRSGLRRAEVVALRAPFEYVLGAWDPEVGAPVQDSSVLSTVTHASAYLERYTSYRTPLVQCIIQFKWEHYGWWIFVAEFAFCLVHVAVVLALYNAAFRSRRLIRIWPRKNRCRSVADFTLAPAAAVSALAAGLELRQIANEGLAAYLAQLQLWKVVDLLCYSLQLLVDACLLARIPRRGSVALLAALNVLCFTGRVVSFARGVDNLGPLIRMIVKIVYEVRFFCSIVAVIILGFLASFSVILGQPPTILLWSFLTLAGLIGHVSEEKGVVPDAWRPKNPNVIMVFLVFSLMVGVLAINLMIAIMNSAYKEVKASSYQEMLHEKARILLAIDRFWLAYVIKFTGIPPSFFFPKWLLILAPLHDNDTPRSPSTWPRQQHKRQQ